MLNFPNIFHRPSPHPSPLPNPGHTLHLAVMSLQSLHSRIFLSLTLTNCDILEESVILQLILPKCLVNAAPAGSPHYFCLAINKEFVHRPSGPVPA